MQHRQTLTLRPQTRLIVALLMVPLYAVLPQLTAAEAGAAPDTSLATIAPEQQKSWTEVPPAQRHGADQMWTFNKAEYHATVLLTQTEIGGVTLASVIDKVLDQIDKQFAIKPEKAERQFAAANAMGYKVIYQATNRGSSRYQVQYFIPKNERLYILTCSCKKGTELGIDFDGFADSFVPPARK
ncbi:MAG TPA: hypothetical protein VL860_11855 [Planctomycetota bacterium]|nr:hypothetical protein [Planctomycetota bacterium]